MKVFEHAQTLRAELKSTRQRKLTIGLVPTMGNLHSGHLALVKKARESCDYVLATIFVNPSQFGENEDFANYPKTIEADQQKLIEAGCDGLFMPSVAEMYPNGLKHQTTISVPIISSLHCGASRPGHFDGVCTVVSKLLNLTGPDIAFFGDKDFQQLFIIRKMVTDLCMPIEIVGIPIERESSGLALSSRNGYLSSEGKSIAATLFTVLNQAKAEILDNPLRNYSEIEESAKRVLQGAGMKPDYFTVCSADSLQPASKEDHRLVILAAAYLGRARLIDNIVLESAGTRPDRGK